ncbi:MAG: type II toxin-antitoxin system RelE/ParE family toxin [Candidatus Gastranaerophilaceae bacterium]
MDNKRIKPLEVKFYSTMTGKMPVADWLNEFSEKDQKVIGKDIKTIQLGYPLGMPLVRALSNTGGLKEIRCNISNGRIARIIFYVENDIIYLLHGFIKKTQKTPKNDLSLAIKRHKDLCE